MAGAICCISGMGATTAIGRGAWVSAAAVRAGLCGFRLHPYMIDTAGEAMRVAAVPGLDVSLPMAERCVRMLLPALAEALAQRPELQRVALAVGLPLQRPGRHDDLAKRVADAVHGAFGARVSRLTFHECGHAAGFSALDAAVEALAGGSLQACLVAGVDSYLVAETLEWVEACDQLHGGGPLNNAWGFIPGEAAGALLLERAGAAGSVAEVIAIGRGRERRLIKTDSVCIGEGLTEAFRTSFSLLGESDRIDDVVADLNGEAYRAEEYGFACLRTSERFREATDFVAPADCWGDVGAAGVPLHAMLAIAACRKGYANGERSLVSASSEGGERGALVVRTPIAERE